MFQEVITPDEQGMFQSIRDEAWLSQGFRIPEDQCKQLIIKNGHGKFVGGAQLAQLSNVDVTDTPYNVFLTWEQASQYIENAVVLDGFAMLRERIGEGHLKEILDSIFEYTREIESSTIFTLVDPLIHRILRFGFRFPLEEATEATHDISQLIPVRIDLQAIWRKEALLSPITSLIERDMLS